MDVVAFCEKRNDPVAFNAVFEQKEYAGLEGNPFLEQQLARGEYIPVLKSLWCEKDSERKIKWLRSKQDGTHAPLLYELAVEEFLVQPTLRKLYTFCIPIVKTANLRVYQDAACLKANANFPDIVSERMDSIYMKCLENLSETILKRKLEDIPPRLVKESDKETLNMWVAIATFSFSLKIPEKNWLRWYYSSVPSMCDYEIPQEENPREIINKLARSVFKNYS